MNPNWFLEAAAAAAAVSLLDEEDPFDFEADEDNVLLGLVVFADDVDEDEDDLEDKLLKTFKLPKPFIRPD